MRRRVPRGLAAVILSIAVATGTGCGLQRKTPTTPLPEAAGHQMQLILAPYHAVLGRPRQTSIVLAQAPEAEEPRDRLIRATCRTSLRYVIRSPWAVPGGTLAVGFCNGKTDLTPAMIAAAKAALDPTNAPTSPPVTEDIGSGLEADYLPVVLVGDGATERFPTLIARRSRSGPLLLLQLDQEQFCHTDANRPSVLCTNPRQALIEMARGLADYL